MSSSSRDGEGEMERYPTVGPGAAAYEGYESRESDDGIRIYESGREESGAWLASTVAISRPSLR
ncbi:hypothetical protein [Haloglomus salinum]|jgi:hypothetical protein|uniref:hypothetical protein n=1 Tax=Haloglomus salinum TaxID=2962673 RepID=UPI0020C99780|nr:hypothetical protein [Haloglomus salinum]